MPHSKKSAENNFTYIKDDSKRQPRNKNSNDERPDGKKFGNEKTDCEQSCSKKSDNEKLESKNITENVPAENSFIEKKQCQKVQIKQ